MSDEISVKRWGTSFKKVILSLFFVFLIIEIVTLPLPWTVASLRTENPKSTAFMKERIRQAAAKHMPYKIRQIYVPLSGISNAMVHAAVVGEDGTFYEHGGVDWYEVEQSLQENWKEKKIVRGSSTITMQLAKNLWFSTSRDPLTKLDEIIAGYMLEHFLSKNRIIELYLNYIEFGNGIFGVESASRIHFNIPASQLSREQAARLSAIIPSPVRHSPDSTSRFVSSRSEIILTRMEARGW
ncbi:MAG: monofunctional biosynthetic peptidoglycan transglycosylase [Candidatus Kryptoniota bacterium]